MADRERILKIRMNGVEVKSYFDYMQEETYKIDVELISNEWLLYGYGFKILHSPVQNRIKRIFDIHMIECGVKAENKKFIFWFDILR